MLSTIAKTDLARHLDVARAQHKDDVAVGAGWVELPTALNRGPAAVRSPADRMFCP